MLASRGLGCFGQKIQKELLIDHRNEHCEHAARQSFPYLLVISPPHVKQTPVSRRKKAKCALKGLPQPSSFKEEVVCVYVYVCMCVCVHVCAVLPLMTKGKDLFGGLSKNALSR